MKFVKGIKTIENGYLEKIYIINPKTIIKIEKNVIPNNLTKAKMES